MSHSIHPVDQLHEISRQLCLRLKEAGIETVPDEVHWGLLQQADGHTPDAIHNGKLYLDCKRPVSELVFELSNFGRTELPRATWFQRFVAWVLGVSI